MIYNAYDVYMIYDDCFCGMVDQQKVVSRISSQHNGQRSSLLRISDSQPAGFERAQNLSSGLVEWSCGAMITTTVHNSAYIYRSICICMVVTIPTIMVGAVLHGNKMLNLEKFDHSGILKIQKSYLCGKLAGLVLHSQKRQFTSVILW